MKHLSETAILKRYSQPPGEPPDTDKSKPSGSIAVFPTDSMDMPTKTFENTLKRREKNHRMLIQWIQKNLKPDIHYGRCHVDDNCKFAVAGVPHQCRDFSHMSMITLWKAGAEIIIRLLGLTACFPTVHDYELACVHRQEISTVILKCELKTSNGNIIGEGTGSRHIKQDGWNLNKTIKMACKSAMIDATIRVAGLSEIFMKTHRHTLTKLGYVPGMGACNNYKLTYQRVCNTVPDKAITAKQKQFIQKIAGRKGMTAESLERHVHNLFKKNLNDLNRVEASKFIQQSL